MLVMMGSPDGKENAFPRTIRSCRQGFPPTFQLLTLLGEKGHFFVDLT
jgi:hypothetical protein